MFFTQHAVERFRERFAGGLTFRHARYELCVLARTAVLLRERTTTGEQQWQVTDGEPFILVTKRDRNFRDPVCVTVLYGAESADEEPPP